MIAKSSVKKLLILTLIIVVGGGAYGLVQNISKPASEENAPPSNAQNTDNSSTKNNQLDSNINSKPDQNNLNSNQNTSGFDLGYDLDYGFSRPNPSLAVAKPKTQKTEVLSTPIIIEETKPEVKTQPQAPEKTEFNYTATHINQETGEVVLQETKTGKKGEEITVTAADLFDKGLELLDEESKTILLDEDNKNVTFKYGKSRELMTMREFLSREVDYDHPLKYRNLDFTGRQEDLEDFVVKHIYQGNRTTGKFYGTRDQALLVRQKMLNGSFQGGYFRYATNVRDMIPEHIEGDKYSLEIELDYKEDLDYIKEAERKITTDFYNKYAPMNLSEIEKAKLIQDWLVKNVKNFPNPDPTDQSWPKNTNGSRRLHFTSSAMLDGEGVCLTYAMTYARMAERMGMDVRVVSAGTNTYTKRYGESPEVELTRKMMENPDTTTYQARFLNHASNMVKIGDKWYHVDVYHDINIPLNFKIDDKYAFFLQSDENYAATEIAAETRTGKREFIVSKVWNKNRIYSAPESLNEEARKLPNLAE